MTLKVKRTVNAQKTRKGIALPISKRNLIIIASAIVAIILVVIIGITVVNAGNADDNKNTFNDVQNPVDTTASKEDGFLSGTEPFVQPTAQPTQAPSTSSSGFTEGFENGVSNNYQVPTKVVDYTSGSPSTQTVQSAAPGFESGVESTFQPTSKSVSTQPSSQVLQPAAPAFSAGVEANAQSAPVSSGFNDGFENGNAFEDIPTEVVDFTGY